jgi:hypothetical protein
MKGQRAGVRLGGGDCFVTTVRPLNPAFAHARPDAHPASEAGPAAAPARAADVLGLQRSAGNRAVRQMVGSGAVLARSPSFSTAPTVADDFRAALDVQVRALGNLAATIKKLVPEPSFESRDIRDKLESYVDQLAWITEATGRAAQLVAEGEAAPGEAGERKFAEAGTELTAAVFGLKAVAVLLTYDFYFYELIKEHSTATDRAAMGVRTVHGDLDPVLASLRLRQRDIVDTALSHLASNFPADWAYDFSQIVDETNEQIEKDARVAAWINIAMLAWNLYDIWMLPVVGRPGGGGGVEPPQIGGMGGDGGAVAVGGGSVAVTADALAALGRLAAIGAITMPNTVKFLRGRTGGIEAPPKAIEASTKDRGRSGAPETGASSAGGGKAPAGGEPARLPEGVPTAAEDAVLERYTEALAKLREKLVAYRGMKPKPGEPPARFRERLGRARTAYESAQRALDEIETDALRRSGSDLAGHLDPLVEARRELERQGPVITVGRRVPCDALKAAPRLRRGMDFAEIEEKIGRLPDHVDPAPKPKGYEPGSHQRLEWKFKDGSRLVVDKPARPTIHDASRPVRPATAELPHVEVHGPEGERLDPQGIEVPKRSAPGHMTITDHAGALERQFARQRKGL